MKVNEYETKSGKPIRLFNGDCMEFMNGLEEDAYDLAIVDPPYGIGRSGQKESINKNPKHNRKHFEDKGWDNEAPNAKYFTELFSISDNQILWGANYYPQMLSESKGWVVWDKGQYGLTMSDCELAYSSFKEPTRIYKKNRAVFIDQGTIHPTEKPIHLYRWLLKNYAEQDDTILDTHGGSMSLAIACYIEDFELDIIELDEDYYSDAVQRFENHISQKTLF
jgi:site-specific DNA-methyltransferase (adenine-specific)